ncbi:LysE family translocator [Microbaculum marinum]|uniref:LysE family translocator n=1 Tax=Microbaculum marinum TaxID=1764581 RepID=A0AAW9RMY5_9HYPH
MTYDLLVALAGFAFVMSISPGPSNFILLATGATHGFARSLPIVFGVSFGFLSMVLAVGLGIGPVLQAWPLAGIALKVACAVYVVRLAIRIARSRPAAARSAAGSPEPPISFTQAAMLQLVNPKAWTVALIVTVSYTVPDDYLASLAAMIAVFALVNLPSISLWAAFGVAVGRLLQDPGRLRLFNIAMAVLLVASMAPVLLDISPPA